MKIFHKNNYNTALLIIIFLIFTAGILITGYKYYKNYRKEYIKNIEQQLEATANLKKSELELYRKERLADGNIIFQNPAFTSLVSRYFYQNDPDAKRKITSWLNKYHRYYQYEKILLLDTRPIARLTIPSGTNARCSVLEKKSRESIRSGRVSFMDFHKDSQSVPHAEHVNSIHLSVIVPLIDQIQNKAIGVLVLWINPEKYLYPFINRWPWISETGETLLVRREGKDVLFLNELKFKKYTALNLKFPADKPDLPASMAVRGKTGIVEGKDYRGIPVIAAIQKVSGSPWYIVARIDKNEIYTPLRQRIWMTLVIGFALIFILGTGIGFIWRSQKLLFFKEKYAAELERNWLHDLVARSLNEVYVFDPGTMKFLFANAGAIHNIGYSMEELSQLTPLDIKPEMTENKFNDIIHPLLSGENEIIVFETIHMRKNATKYPVEVHLQLIESGGGGGKVFLAVINDITERMKAVEALRESEKQFRLLVESAPDAIYIQTDLHFTYVNNAAVRLFGAESSDQLIGTYIIDRFHHSFHDRILKRIENLTKEKAKQPVDEHLFLRLDGSEIPVEASSVPITFEGKDSALVFVRDITERKQSQEALRKNEERLRLSLQASKQGLFDLNLHTGEIITNDQYAIMLGYDPAAFIETFLNWTKRLHPDDKKKTKQAYADYLENKIPDYRTEFRLKTSTGEWRWILSVAKIVEYDTLGNPLRIIGTHTDITERKLSEQLLAEEKERLSVTLKSIGDGVITTDQLGRVLIMNKIAEELTGWKAEEAHLKPLEDVFNIVDEFTREPHENPVKNVLATGTISELANHTILISRDGTERIIADSGAPIKDRNGHIIGIILVFRDMTEKQKLLEHLQRTEKLNSLGVLAGGIAHDFNNLLNAVYGYIELARDTGPGDNNYVSFLDKALQSYNMAKNLTHQLLTFAKGGTPVLKTDEISPILEESAAFALSGSNISYNLKIHENLWLCDIDKNQICQVINNILINAQQAMGENGNITIIAENVNTDKRFSKTLSNEKYIKISITDTGPGIPEEISGKIFDPFFTTKTDGSGLGLTTSHSIIQHHNGFIEMDSKPGQGSTFYIYLPASLNKTANGKPDTGIKHSGTGTIIIMDDEEYIREIAGLMLTDMGYNPVGTADGDETLKYFQQACSKGIPVKAMILDLTISGGKGGKEIINEIRSQDTSIPVFASSGYSEDPVISRPKDYGFTDSISKPYRKAELAELLNRYFYND